jgi:hypothetical protein
MTWSPLFVIDMTGLHSDRAIRCLAQRPEGSYQDVYIVREPFFLQCVNGRVAPHLVERQIGYLERDILEGFGGEVSLEDFTIALVILDTVQPDFCLQVAEELTTGTGKHPRIVAVQQQENAERLRIVDAVLLPCRWRCKENDTVILTRDVWLFDQPVQEPPAWPRGQPFVIVRTHIALKDRGQVKQCLLTMAYLAQSNGPVSLILPWELVEHPSVWQDASPQDERSRAVATFQLPCWYSVRIEEEQDQNVGELISCPPE